MGELLPVRPISGTPTTTCMLLQLTNKRTVRTFQIVCMRLTFGGRMQHQAEKSGALSKQRFYVYELQWKLG